MLVRHGGNVPVEGIVKVAASELPHLVERNFLLEYTMDVSSYRIPITICKHSFTLHFSSYKSPIAFGGKTPSGAFALAEKWMYPYWKKNGVGFLPSDKNPIGSRLFVLADLYTGKRVPQSIHACPNNNGRSFEKGMYTNGCIRLPCAAISQFFDQIPLGTPVLIQD